MSDPMLVFATRESLLKEVRRLDGALTASLERTKKAEERAEQAEQSLRDLAALVGEEHVRVGKKEDFARGRWEIGASVLISDEMHRDLHGRFEALSILLAEAIQKKLEVLYEGRG